MPMRKAFTLIELMIVIAIAGILLAIAIPKFSHLYHCGGDKKNTTACRNYEARMQQQVMSSSSLASYRLSDGRVVRCSSGYTEACGMRLYDCADSNIYQCQTNVVTLPRE
jgi:prepilin-type N-terminal cleavage/methylation domain-containing protein